MKTMTQAIGAAAQACSGDRVQMIGYLGKEVEELSEELDRAKARISELVCQVIDMERD